MQSNLETKLNDALLSIFADIRKDGKTIDEFRNKLPAERYQYVVGRLRDKLIESDLDSLDEKKLIQAVQDGYVSLLNSIIKSPPEGYNDPETQIIPVIQERWDIYKNLEGNGNKLSKKINAIDSINWVNPDLLLSVNDDDISRMIKLSEEIQKEQDEIFKLLSKFEWDEYIKLELYRELKERYDGLEDAKKNIDDTILPCLDEQKTAAPIMSYQDVTPEQLKAMNFSKHPTEQYVVMEKKHDDSISIETREQKSSGLPAIDKDKQRVFFIRPCHENADFEQKARQGVFSQKEIYDETDKEKPVVKKVDFKVHKWPEVPEDASDDTKAQIEKAKVEMSMAMAAQAVEALGQKPTRTHPLTLSGGSAEQARYMWTALMVMGQQNKNLQINPNVIQVTHPSFDPSKELNRLGRFSDESCYQQHFKEYMGKPLKDAASTTNTLMQDETADNRLERDVDKMRRVLDDEAPKQSKASQLKDKFVHLRDAVQEKIARTTTNDLEPANPTNLGPTSAA